MVLTGKRISTVRRWLFVDDYNFYPPETRDQAADGPTEITTEDGLVFSVAGNTEAMTVEVTEGLITEVGPSGLRHTL